MAKREAQQRIVQVLLPDEGITSEIKLQRSGPDEQWVVSSETNGND